MVTTEAKFAPAEIQPGPGVSRSIEGEGGGDVLGTAEGDSTDSRVLGSPNTVCHAMTTAALAAAMWGGVDVIAVALCGRCIPWYLPLVIIGTYLSIGVLSGALLGAVYPLLARRGRARRGPRRALADIRIVCLAGSVAVASVVFAERLDFDHASEFGLQLRPGSIVLAVVVFVGCVIAFRRLFTGCPARWSYPWQAFCVAAFCLLWTPFNKLYEAPVLSGTSLLANACYLLVAVAVYLSGRALMVRSSDLKIRDTPTRYLRQAFAVSVLGFCVASTIISCGRRTPIDRTYAFAGAAGSEVPAYPNVVLIVMDTARADHLSTYGYHRETTPHLTKFAEDAVLYSHAISTTSWTFPSHASLFTGLMPTEHGAHYHTTKTSDGKYLRPLDDGHTTLAEVLLANGYRTGAFIANMVPLKRELGMHQGFLHYDDLPRVGLDTARPQTISPAAWMTTFYQGFTGHDRVRLGYEFRDSTEINEAVLSWVGVGVSGPFFAFVNYVDPHAPYRAHPEYDVRLDKVPVCAGSMATVAEDAAGNMPSGSTPPGICGEMANYDAELAYLDERIDALFGELKARNLYDDSLIIVTSDHGEAFFEHGAKGHFNSLYEEEVHIPLMIRYPGGSIRGVEPTVTSLRTVFSKVLTYLELPEPEGTLRSAPADQPSVMAELYLPDLDLGGAHQVTMQALYYQDGLKAIRTVPPEVRRHGQERHELYDLVRDPGELSDLSGAYPALTCQISVFLMNWIREAKARAPETGDGYVMTAELREQLRSLGYLD